MMHEEGDIIKREERSIVLHSIMSHHGLNSSKNVQLMFKYCSNRVNSIYEF